MLTNGTLSKSTLPVIVYGCPYTASWGISSNGRALAQHVRGTGIDTRILQVFVFLLLIFTFQCLILITFSYTNVVDFPQALVFHIQLKYMLHNEYSDITNNFKENNSKIPYHSLQKFTIAYFGQPHNITGCDFT